MNLGTFTSSIARSGHGDKGEEIIAASDKCAELFPTTVLYGLKAEHLAPEVGDAIPEDKDGIRERIVEGINLDLSNGQIPIVRTIGAGTFRIEFNKPGSPDNMVTDAIVRHLTEQDIDAGYAGKFVDFALKDKTQIEALGEYAEAQQARSALVNK